MDVRRYMAGALPSRRACRLPLSHPFPKTAGKCNAHHSGNTRVVVSTDISFERSLVLAPVQCEHPVRRDPPQRLLIVAVGVVMIGTLVLVQRGCQRPVLPCEAAHSLPNMGIVAEPLSQNVPGPLKCAGSVRHLLADKRRGLALRIARIAALQPVGQRLKPALTGDRCSCAPLRPEGSIQIF